MVPIWVLIAVVLGVMFIFIGWYATLGFALNGVGPGSIQGILITALLITFVISITSTFTPFAVGVLCISGGALIGNIFARFM